MKAKQVRLYYGIFLSAFTCVMGVLFIVQAVSILADGGWIQGAFTREIVAERLFPISIPFYIWIVAVIAGLILSVIFPVKVGSVNKVSERVTQKRLSARLPQGEGEDYNKQIKQIATEKRSRTIVYSVCAALCFASAIACAVYLLTPANYTASSINGAMLNMLINAGPWILVAFAACIGMALYEKFSLLREITVLKALISSNKGNPVIKADVSIPAALVKFKKVLASKYTVWSIRGGVAVIAITFIFLGIFNEGARDVLVKAINICTECIGLG
ncbi:MAG: hypothetical protein K2L42_01395 [Clostridia bacterium]|nr:hypothetical protein [Clostridia bacterium]